MMETAKAIAQDVMLSRDFLHAFPNDMDAERRELQRRLGTLGTADTVVFASLQRLELAMVHAIERGMAAERAACAKIADASADEATARSSSWGTASAIAATIRARGSPST